MSSATVAVLFQAIDPPIINGVKKPPKPGGYQDSGADIAYSLQQKGIKVVTPTANPAPQSYQAWCFPDTEDGILSAIQAGATHIWANTILFSSHPLQASGKLNKHAKNLNIIGQPPSLFENCDDKAYLNQKLRETGLFTLPSAWLVDETIKPKRELDTIINSVPYPIVAKPVRGRGSHGVKVCHVPDELREHMKILLSESPVIMLEQFLAGEEATLTVMPPSSADDDGSTDGYYCLPPVTRFNHEDDIAPYNGVVAVTRNSKAISEDEIIADPTYAKVMKQCAQVAELIKATGPIRIDVRRFRHGERFALFDINMKPNMTGPGRLGREDQASLTAMAAAAVGWDYPTLLLKMLQSSRSLDELRNYVSPF